GIQQVRRFRSATEFMGDAIYDLDHGIAEPCTIVDPADPTRRKQMPPSTPFEDLLVPIFRRGSTVEKTPRLSEIRDRTRQQLSMFHSGIKRFLNPHQYPVGLESNLHDLKTKLILQARGLRQQG